MARHTGNSHPDKGPLLEAVEGYRALEAQLLWDCRLMVSRAHAQGREGGTQGMGG